jgi:hypothetical protein
MLSVLLMLEFPFDLTREKKAERTFGKRHRAIAQARLRRLPIQS